MSNKIIILCAVVSVIIFCLALISLTAGAPGGSQGASAPLDLGYVPGELLVRFAPKANGIQRSTGEKNQILSSLGQATVKENYKIVPGLSHVKLPAGVTVEQAIAQLKTKEGIMYAQPNHYLMLCSGQRFPNDPYGPKPAPEGGYLWGMHNTGQEVCDVSGTPDADIDAPEAWDIKTDASDIIVAVIDSGVDYEHEDLAANMWINPGEDHPPLGVVGPEDFDGVNDDENYDPEGNPLIDDIYGYDFCTIGTKERDSDPNDDDPQGGHGTHIAGTIGAVGDNEMGVTGVCWKVKIMALRLFLNNTDFGKEDDAIACIQYAVDKGAKVISCSWGRYYWEWPPYEALKENIEAAGASGVLFVAAVNNHNYNIDQYPFYPASYDLDNIISVMATDENDDRPWWSNYGATSVDLAAPGTCIWSCLCSARGGGYVAWAGTSMSTPHVAGACALVWAVNPSLSHLEVKGIVLSTVDELDDLGGRCVTEGRLNLNNAVLEAVDFPTDDELVGWWKLDETSGVTAPDSSGYDNDGTLADSPHDPAWVEDLVRGWCLDFDGNDYVSLPQIVALVTDNVTISAWIKADDVSAGLHPIVAQYRHEGDNWRGYLLYLYGDEPRFFLGGAGRAEATDISIIEDKWYHLVGTNDASNLRIYVDGVEEGTRSPSDYTGINHDPYIGYDGDGNYFDGKIDDVRVYNYALDMFEIWDVMSGELPRFRIKNSSDETVAWFDSFGNLCLKGELEENSDFDPPTGHDEFKFKDSNGDDVMIIDTTNGDMYIKESKHENHDMELHGQHRFIIKDSNGDRVAYINDLGDLYLKGILFENANP